MEWSAEQLLPCLVKFEPLYLYDVCKDLDNCFVQRSIICSESDFSKKCSLAFSFVSNIEDTKDRRSKMCCHCLSYGFVVFVLLSEPPAPRQIAASPLNDFSLEVRWTSPQNRSVSGFVVEWFAVRENRSSVLHWEKLNSSCRKLLITGNPTAPAAVKNEKPQFRKCWEVV